MEQLLKKEHVAKALNVSTRTINRLVQTGVLPAVKIGSRVRIRPESVQELIQGIKDKEGAQ